MTSENWQGINIKGGKPTIKDNTFIFESPKQNSPNNLLYSGSANFVGREYELSQVGEKLQKQDFVAISAVSGMGGVGKTELALRYARQHEADYPGGICWLNARDSNLAAEIVQFTQLNMNLEVPQQDFRGRALSLTEQVAWCWQHWQPPEGRVLIVLDDVTSLEGCRDVLPRANRFRVLMTTRSRNLDSNIEEISLDVLSPEEALELLTALVGTKRVQKELSVAKQLCEWLGYLPLGLELVGRYLAKKPPNWSLAHMLQQLKEQLLSNVALKLEQQQTLSTAQRGVLAAFELSWLELPFTTQRVAALLSLFAPNIFAWEWVESATGLLNWTSDDVETANDQLYGLHLIQSVEDTEDVSKFRIHTLIREFLKVKLAATEQAFELKQAFAETIVTITEKITVSPTQELISSVKDAIPHLAEVAQNLTDAVSDEKLIWVFTGLGWFYQGQGLYALAQPWLEQCVLVVKSRLTEEHLDYASSLNNLANLYSFLWKHKKAEPLFIQALKLRKKLLTEEHLDYASSLNNLANLYHFQRKHKEAEPLFIQALELRKKLLGEEHLDYASSLNNLANSYNFQHKFDKAKPLYIQALELRKKLLGEEHLDYASSLNNLANIYKIEGKYDEALPLFIQALKLRKKLLGEEHPQYAAILHSLAYVYYGQKKYDKAEQLYIQTLELRKKLLGEDHPDYATSLHRLGELYHSLEKNEEAEQFYIQALDIRKSILGEEHPDIAQSYSYLARLYKNQGRYSEAEPLYQKALSLRQRLLGEEHLDVAISYNNLAGLYKNQGRYSEAEPLYQKALSLRQRLLGEEDPDVADSYNNLANLYKNQGRYSEAEPLYQKALSLRQRLLGEDPDVADSYNNLANLYKNQGRYSEAELLYQQALEIALKSLGVDHPSTTTIRENLKYLRDTHL